jgi:hypothetical protein
MLCNYELNIEKTKKCDLYIVANPGSLLVVVIFDLHEPIVWNVNENCNLIIWKKWIKRQFVPHLPLVIHASVLSRLTHFHSNMCWLWTCLYLGKACVCKALMETAFIWTDKLVCRQVHHGYFSSCALYWFSLLSSCMFHVIASCTCI